MELQNQLSFCEKADKKCKISNKKGKISTKKGKIYLYNYADTYYLDDGIKHCVEQIKNLKKSKKFYIGATHNYKERFLEHMENKKMYNMFILTLAQTYSKSKKMEQKLIKRFGSKKLLNKVEYDDNGNILNGGGGEGLTHDKNYIYVLFK